MTCNKCFQSTCYCSPIVSSTTINSNQAGRDGLSAKQTLINIGKLPKNATDEDFANYIQGGTIIENKQVYKDTKW